MAAPKSSTSNQVFSVVDREFCINSTTKFTVRRRPAVASNVGRKSAVASNVGGMDSVIQDSEHNEKFKLEGLALKYSDGKLILTVKPEDTMLERILNFFGTVLPVYRGHFRWNVFLTMEPEPSFTVDTSGVNWMIEVRGTDYKFEGSFSTNSRAESIFTIFDISRGSCIAAEVKLEYKDGDIKIDSVYGVTVKPGYNQAFIFGLVAVFEQIRLNIH